MAGANRSTLIIAAALISSVAMPDTFLRSPTYSSERAAAIAALSYVAAVAVEDTKPTEYVGVIYELGGKYLFTAPVAGDANQAVVADIKYPAQARLAALYHNHVSGPGNEEFSSIDIRTARALRVPTYLYVADTREVLRWHPDDTQTIHYRLGLGNPQTRGQVIARIRVEEPETVASR